MSNLGHGVYDVDKEVQQDWERRYGEWEYVEVFGGAKEFMGQALDGWTAIGLAAGQRSMMFGRRRKDWETVTTSRGTANA